MTSACGRQREDGEAEGAFGDEGVGADGLEGFGEAVGRGLVVARDDPDLARDFDADLGGAGDVARGVEGDGGVADFRVLAIGLGGDADVAEAVADDRRGGGGREVARVAGAGVVGVAVGDERAVHGAPGVDEEVARGAVDAAVGDGEDGLSHGREPSAEAAPGNRGAAGRFPWRNARSIPWQSGARTTSTGSARTSTGGGRATRRTTRSGGGASGHR